MIVFVLSVLFLLAVLGVPVWGLEGASLWIRVVILVMLIIQFIGTQYVRRDK